MNDLPEQEEPDEPSEGSDAWAAQWLDGDAAPPAEQDAANVDARRVADLAFLHALLEEVHADEPTDVGLRVERVMAAIEEPSATAPFSKVELEEALSTVPSATVPSATVPSATVPSTTVPSSIVALASRAAPHSAPQRRRWLVSSLSAAAALLALAAWYWSAPPGRVASAAVRRVYRDAARLADRQYRVTTEVSTGGEELTQLESLLWVRGGQKFVLRHPGLLGPVWIGNNGTRGWFVPAVGKAQLEQDPISTRQWARRAGVALPELQVSALIKHLDRFFDLELLPNERIAGQGNIYWQRVRAIRRNHDPERPRTIELWAHPETGVAQRLILDWQRAPGELGLERVTLNLIDEQPQDDSWYESATHPSSFPILPIQLFLSSSQP